MIEIVQRLTEARDSDAELQEKIWACAEGRTLSMDEDSDQSYLEGKVVAYNHAIDMLTIKVCPKHEGAFDCTPFCSVCEGNQEYVEGGN